MPKTVLKTTIFRIIHIKNLSLCIEHGLLSPNNTPKDLAGHYVNIYDPNIQSNRGTKKISIRKGLTLHDYVPFNFCPRTPMLYTLNAKKYANQEDILHLEAFAEDIANAGNDFVITDRNARSGAALWYESLDDIRTKLDWNAISSNRWSENLNPPPPYDTKSKKQAEFMVFKKVDWSFIIGIAAMNERTKIVADAILRKQNVSIIKTRIQRNWYY